MPTEKDLEMAKDIICDICSSPMTIKVGKYGKFYGCTNYPKCKGIKPVTLGIECPKCGKGEILQRKSKGGRFFYGCTKYPDCDFIANTLPVIQTCTNCGNKYLLKKSSKKDGDYLECPECKNRTEDQTVNENELSEKD